MTEVATAALAGLSVAEATPQTAANHGMPPGRVRHMFKTLDTDGNGTLSSEELKTGFAKEFKVDALAPHVRTTEARTNPRSGPHHKRRPPVGPFCKKIILHRPLPSCMLPCIQCKLCTSAPIPAAQVVARMDEMFGLHADEKDGGKAP